MVRPVTSLGQQEEQRVFREGSKFFKLCPMFLNYVPHIFPEGDEIFSRGSLAPPASTLVTVLSMVNMTKQRTEKERDYEYC